MSYICPGYVLRPDKAVQCIYDMIQINSRSLCNELYTFEARVLNTAGSLLTVLVSNCPRDGCGGPGGPGGTF